MADINGNDVMVSEEDFVIDATKDLFLLFEVDDENYAIEIASVKEIIQMVDITPVPETAPFVKGIINLRGDIAPVISVRKRFLKEEKPYDDLTCIIVLKTADLIIGLIVDSVSGSETITEDNIMPAPSAKLNYANQFVNNIGKYKGGVRLLLDVEKLLFS